MVPSSSEQVQELRPTGDPEDRSRRVEVSLLGRFEVRLAGAPIDLGTPKQRAVLAVLALEANRVVPSDRLIQLLWADAPKALGALQSYVSNLRRALEPDRRPRDPARVLVTEAPGYRLAIDRELVDTLRFEELVRRGRVALGAGDAAEAVSILDAALAAWGGPPLPELRDEPFVVDVAGRLDGQRVIALGLAAQARLELGDHLGAVGLLDGPIADYPLDERLHGLLALALYRGGRQADALRVIDRVRRALADTAGLDPGHELRTLEADLLRQAPHLDGPASTVRPTGVVASGPTRVARSPGPAGPLVGRSGELDALLAALDTAVDGGGGVAVVVGESGIGKTRLVEELAAVARSRGVGTAWVRCPESGAIPPFWPVVQLAGQIPGTVDLELPTTDGSDADMPSSVFALYDTVSASLARMASPLLLVIDDLQWADADTLRMLGHVVGALESAPVLLAVTVRPTDRDAGPALVDGLAALVRAQRAVHVQLGGLSPSAVADWLDRRSGTGVPAEVAATVHERTGGHPLFVKELSELLASEGCLDDVEAVRRARTIPVGVQAVVRRRIARLPASTQQLVSTASVVGRSFDLAVLATVAGCPLEDALADLEPALSAGLLDVDGPSRVRFSHALIAETLAAELNAARRARVHAATARALVERVGGVHGPDLALIAHHAIGGVMAGTADLAVEASIEAARLAAARLGHEDAASHWMRVVEVLASARPGDLAARIDALCEQAAASFHADLVPAAKAAVLEAIELAEYAGDAASMARAAALLGTPHLWPTQHYGSVDGPTVAALERTCRAVAHDGAGVRARVMGALAVELTYAGESVAGTVRVAAEDLARDADDPAVLGRVLVNVADPLSPTTLAEREARADEVIGLAAEHDVPVDVELAARFQFALAAWERADFPAALARLESCRRLFDRHGGGAMRAQLGYFEAATAVVLGRYDEATRLGHEASQLYRRTRRYDADLIDLALFGAIAADRGGVEPVLERLGEARRASPHYDRFGAELLAWILCEAGMRHDAAIVIAAIDPATPFGNDYTMLCGASMALHVRVELDQPAAVAPIMAQLDPYRGRWAQAGSGGCSAGLVDLALARGAAALGDEDRARERFTFAVAGHESLRAPGWHARSLVHQGRFLLDTGDRVDERVGRAALERAAQLAELHGLAYVTRRLAEI